MDGLSTDAQRRRRLAIFGGLLLAAVVAVAVIIAVTSGGSKTAVSPGAPAASTKSSDLKGVAAIRSEFAGIPQKANVLGPASAKATLMVFADLQCPFCAEFENKALPVIVQKYVKPGKLRIIFQPIVIIGNDSILGARASAAAGLQNKMFDFNGVLYRNQGQENTGYLNTAYVRKIAGAVPGLDAAKVVADLKAASVNKLLNDAQTIATSGKVNSTPTFFVAKGKQPLQPIAVTSLDASAFTKALDALTAG